MTRVLKAADSDAVLEAAEILRPGGLVAFPTETVYGLGALGLDPAAVERIFIAKGRPHSDPLILHVAEPAWVRDLAREIPHVAARLMEAFWPGPLTLVLPKSDRVPGVVTAGQDSVAVRMPRHPVALELIRQVGAPLAAPSANLFSRPSPTSAQHVLEDLDGRIDAVLDGGPTEVGVESTVLDVRAEVPVILRPGGVTREELEAALGLGPWVLGPAPDFRHPERSEGSQRRVEILHSVQDDLLPDQSLGPNAEHPTPNASPGMLVKHYSPRAEVRLYDGEGATVLSTMRRDIEALPSGKRATVLAFAEDAPSLQSPNATVTAVASREELAQFARWLYYWFRYSDRKGVDVIFVRTAPPGGLGDAINDRLRRAASGRVIRC